jgi:hypothetical protein
MSGIWIRYVAWDRVDKMAEEGWEVLPSYAPTHHDFYGCSMKWAGEGEPPQATIDDKTDAMIAEFRDDTCGLFQP